MADETVFAEGWVVLEKVGCIPFDDSPGHVKWIVSAAPGATGEGVPTRIRVPVPTHLLDPPAVDSEVI